MAPHLDDRYLWLGFGVFFVAAAYGIRYAIKDIIELTRIEPLEQATAAPINKSPEDSISLPTLRTLATSPNPSIANSATSLIVQRFAQFPHVSQILAREMYSKNDTIRRQARTAVEFLKEWPSGPASDDPVNRLELPATPPGSRRGNDWRDDDDEGDGDGVGGGVFVTLESLPDLIDTREGQTGLVPSARSPIAGWTNIPRERPSVIDEGEQERRRRRREAMVLHEGEGRVEESDIFRPR